MTLLKMIDNIKKNFKNSEKYLNNYFETDYKKYIILIEFKFNRERIYIDDEIEVFIITWNKNQETKIHNHAKNGCFLKILEGSLVENVFNFDNLNKSGTKILRKGDISYMDDSIGLHSIKNLDDISVSIHIYSPPNHLIKFY